MMEYIKKYLLKIIDILLEAVYPKRCICCREILPFGTKTYFCPKCAETIKPITGSVCHTCGRPCTSDKCGICLKDEKDEKRYFTRVYSVFEYKDEVRKTIHNMKFNDYPEAVRYFVPVMTEYAEKRGIKAADIVTCVPVSKRRKRERGYNQSELLAKNIAKYGFGIYENVLRKVKNTKDQHSLSGNERRKNLKNAFEVINANRIVGKRIILVDDIYTTGSTVNECSKALIKAGAAEVNVICIAISTKKQG